MASRRRSSASASLAADEAGELEREVVGERVERAGGGNPEGNSGGRVEDLLSACQILEPLRAQRP